MISDATFYLRTLLQIIWESLSFVTFKSSFARVACWNVSAAALYLTSEFLHRLFASAERFLTSSEERETLSWTYWDRQIWHCSPLGFLVQLRSFHTVIQTRQTLPSMRKKFLQHSRKRQAFACDGWIEDIVCVQAVPSSQEMQSGTFMSLQWKSGGEMVLNTHEHTSRNT